MSTQSSTIVQRLWNYCNILRDERLSVVGEVESAEVELVHAGRLRQSVLRSAFEGRL